MDVINIKIINFLPLTNRNTNFKFLYIYFCKLYKYNLFIYELLIKTFKNDVKKDVKKFIKFKI